MPYLLDSIHSAAIYSRPKESGLDLVGHWGIVVKNASGSYLCHNMPKTGTVATPASNMSGNWKHVTDVPVNGEKCIQGMFKSSGLAAYLPQSIAKYLLQGTCVGATSDMAGYLVS